MVDYLSTWKEIDELVKLVTFVGIYRPGFSKETPYPVVWVESPAIDLSSSLIRQYVNQGWPIKYLVPAKVADYIAQKRLYQNGN